jgi:two-component system CheB/CheR fusion protein
MNTSRTVPTAPDDTFEALLTYLRDERGADFTGYKRPSLTRLINRRMQTAGVDSYDAYLDHLQVEPDELKSLLDTLLINVTAMFRDPAAWEEIRENLLPIMLAQLEPDEPIRVWSAACATGEEAYTLAIVLHEILGDEEYLRRVKVYATDADEGALQIARQGRFSATSLEPLTDAQRELYFQPEGKQFRFRPDLRQTIIFGRHDLLQDAPISRVLLLTCRNVLMYFNTDTQARVLERFPFALHEHGILMLGKAEMLLTQSQMFTPVNLSQRIFKARNMARSSRLAALAVGGPGRDIHLRRVTGAAFVAAPDAQLVIDSHGVLTLFNDRAERDLGLARPDLGKPFNELALATRPLDLRGAVAAVQASGQAADYRDVHWVQGAATHWNIRVAPLPDGADVIGVHVVFQDVTSVQALCEQLERAHHDLSTAYEEVQSASEELETANEELQSAVEELETTNEELQSTNEELETMNEEMQSTNEELQALNDELRDRTLQVDDSNGFLQSILEGLDIAVVVVDGDYRVQLWNSGAERLTGLRAFEAEGLLLLDVGLGLPVDEMHAALRGVISGELTVGEVVADVPNRFGRTSRRTLRATSLRNNAKGAVVTFEDSDYTDQTPIALNPPST